MLATSSLSPNLETQPKLTGVSSIKTNKLLPIEGSSSTITAGSQIHFRIPASGVNHLNKDVLSFTLTQGATTNYNAMWMNNCGISQLQLALETGEILCDIPNFNYYMDALLPITSERDEMIHNSEGTALVGYPSPLYSVYGATGGNHTNFAYAFDTAVPSNQVICLMTSSGAASNTAGPALNISLRMKNLIGTPFATSQPFCGNSNLQLTLTFGGPAFVGTNCSSATIIDSTTVTATASTSYALSNIAYYSNIETNPEIIASVRNKIATEGYVFYLPSIYQSRIALTSTSTPSFQMSLLPSMGKIRRIYTALYAGTLTSYSTYDHSNVSQAKGLTLQTSINSSPLQNFPLNMSTFPQENYNALKFGLSKSCIQNVVDFNTKEVWVDAFDGSCDSTNKLGVTLVDKDHSMWDAGLELSGNSLWECLMTSANAAYTAFVWVESTRKFLVTAQGSSFIA